MNYFNFNFNPGFTPRVNCGDKILWCDHSNESSSAVLLHGTICFSILHKIKFGSFLKFWYFALLEVQGLRKEMTDFWFRKTCFDNDLLLISSSENTIKWSLRVVQEILEVLHVLFVIVQTASWQHMYSLGPCVLCNWTFFLSKTTFFHRYIGTDKEMLIPSLGRWSTSIHWRPFCYVYAQMYTSTKNWHHDSKRLNARA